MEAFKMKSFVYSIWFYNCFSENQSQTIEFVANRELDLSIDIEEIANVILEKCQLPETSYIDIDFLKLLRVEDEK